MPTHFCIARRTAAEIAQKAKRRGKFPRRLETVNE
jgi:hypothetical protein